VPLLVKAQSLEVHESGTGIGTVSHWETSWGSYDRDYHQTKKLRITVNDVGRQGAGAKVFLYFIGAKEQSHDLFIYNHAALTVNFGGKLQATDEIAAPSLLLNEEHYASWNETYRHGASMQGWIAVGRVGERIFGVTASNQSLLATARSDALTKMMTDAKIKEDHSLPESRTDPSPNAAVTQALATAPNRMQSASPAQKLLTIIKPVEIPVAYGTVSLPAGVKLPYTLRSTGKVRVNYMGAEYDIAEAWTDLAPPTPNR